MKSTVSCLLPLFLASFSEALGRPRGSNTWVVPVRSATYDNNTAPNPSIPPPFSATGLSTARVDRGSGNWTWTTETRITRITTRTRAVTRSVTKFIQATAPATSLPTVTTDSSTLTTATRAATTASDSLVPPQTNGTGLFVEAREIADAKNQLAERARRVPRPFGGHPSKPIAVAPSEPKIAREVETGGFSITQVRNPGFEGNDNSQRNGLRALMRAYAKYGAEMTPAIKTAIKLNPVFREDLDKRGNATGSVTALPQDNDFEYLSPVQIGTPPQTVNVQIDTGSADLWVLSSDTPRHQVTTQALYTPLNSSTSYLLPNYTWKITYGDASGASGIVYRDVVALGSAAAPGQLVGSATRVSRAFTTDPFCSGLLGLGFSRGNSIRPARAKTFVDNMLPRLAAPVFTADLKRGRPGRYDFGYVNQSAYRGHVGYVPVTPKDSIWWQFSATGYQVGVSGPRMGGGWSAIADTGTSLLLLPNDIVARYYSQVRGSGYDAGWAGRVFPCHAVLPDWNFFLGTYRGTVPGRYMRYGQINQTHCFGGMQSSEGIGFAVFGDVALKAQFVVFDLGKMQVGFANKALRT